MGCCRQESTVVERWPLGDLTFWEARKQFDAFRGSAAEASVLVGKHVINLRVRPDLIRIGEAYAV